MSMLNKLFEAKSTSLKVLKEGSGTFTTPAGNNVSGSATIAHEYGDDRLLWQVALHDSSSGQVYITPFRGGSRYNLRSELNTTNLYILVNLTSAGAAFPGITWTYTYRILIP